MKNKFFIFATLIASIFVFLLLLSYFRTFLIQGTLNFQGSDIDLWKVLVMVQFWAIVGIFFFVIEHTKNIKMLQANITDLKLLAKEMIDAQILNFDSLMKYTQSTRTIMMELLQENPPTYEISDDIVEEDSDVE